ncbi:MAG TPA: GTPase HflX [Candidatus Methylacidiphilales bacterium]|nr:GTPase HflX [Candidatus Methylacidiphilales bacterium]
MKQLHSTNQPAPQERALLIGVERTNKLHPIDYWEFRESLTELAELVRSAGGIVVDTVTQKLENPTAPCYIGRGKAEELAAYCVEHQISTIVFDDDLSPAQSRNLEKIFTRKVIDRTQLILDIFAQRAKTREGKLQIELAQLRYLFPRLTGMWTHLSRQSGGIGSRGPGETQLEVDRRRVEERIARLNRDLQEVRQHRTTQREGRQRHQWPIASLVGYTNAGKSTLLNVLTHAGTLAEDKLFATLDPTTRSLTLPNKQRMLLTDTVGFLKKLPHGLIESFKATLEEVVESDLLIHVVDLSHPQYLQQMDAVTAVLKELKAEDKQILILFNKIDRVENPGLIDSALERFPNSVALSAREGIGVADVLQEIENRVHAWRLRVDLRLPHTETALAAEVHRLGRVLEVRYEDDGVYITAHIPPSLQYRLRPFMIAADVTAHTRNGSRGEAEGTLAAAGSLRA